MVIALTTLPISVLEAPSLVTVSPARAASETADPATRTASEEDWAISRMLADISSVPAATVWTLPETSEEVAPRAFAWAAACCEFVATWADTADSSSALPARVVEVSPISRIASRRDAWAALSERAI